MYTDRYALRPVAWTFLGTTFLLKSSWPPKDLWSLAQSISALVFFGLAIRDVLRRMKARKEGRDPSIYKVVDDGRDPLPSPTPSNPRIESLPTQ
ncbi:hypothetical protein [Sphingomonas sp. ASV193]|uniref:hypothetical protein n=1 Tax=Sphingomonas sp. ASV193 TaxID=3144405 RepID=UPI0032E900F3